jgi:hypothetical protein
VVDGDCTTRRQNAHGTDEREVLYPWHPWAGRFVRIKEVVVRKTGDVFRCVCCDPSMEVVQELPSWMFDRAACAAVRVLTNPLVDFAALRVLRALLNDTTKDRTLKESAPSNTLPLGATMGSHDQNRRETHAQPATSLSSASARDPAIQPVHGIRQRAAAKLPPRTRQELTDLMARLILDHEEERDLLLRETRHDI